MNDDQFAFNGIVERLAINMAKAHARNVAGAKMNKMPETYTLNLTDVDTLTLPVLTRRCGIVEEYATSFKHNDKTYLASVQRAGDEQYEGNIFTGDSIVARSGKWNISLIDRKLNESWEDYIEQ